MKRGSWPDYTPVNAAKDLIITTMRHMNMELPEERELAEMVAAVLVVPDEDVHPLRLVPTVYQAISRLKAILWDRMNRA